jgi:hypothetical protein
MNLLFGYPHKPMRGTSIGRNRREPDDQLGDVRLIQAMDLLRDVLRDALVHRARVVTAFAEN